MGLVVIVALVLGLVSSRFFQTSALGYVLAGILLGPLGMKFLVPNGGLSPVFGEIGFLMLMFYLGLELNLRKFRETGAISVILSIIDMSVMFAGCFVVSKLFGFTDLEAIAIAAMLICTSTVIVAKFLIDRNIIDRIESRIALSVLMLQDFFAIFVLVFLSSLSEQRAFNVVVLNALVFMIGIFFIVSKISRHVLNFLHSIGHGNKMVFYAVGIGIIVAYAGVSLGLSSALGAYFAGFALAETAFGEKIKRELGFFREFFVLFFFVSFGSGLFFNAVTNTGVIPPVSYLLPLVGVTLALVIFYILSRLIVFMLAGATMGIDKYVIGGVATLLMPLGEFVIIIAQAMKPLLSPLAFQNIVTMAFMLILFTAPLTAYFYNNSRRIVDLMSKVFPGPLRRLLAGVGAGASHLEHIAADELGRNKLVSSIEQLAKHLLIAFAVVYLGALLGDKAFEQPIVPGIPKEISVGFIALLLVIWPLYRFVAELKFLVEQLSRQIIHSAFPAVRKKALLVEDEVADVFTGFLLVAIGIFGSFVFWFSFPATPLFMIIPISYTMLALMHLSRAFYSLIEQFESIGDVGEQPSLLEGDAQFRRLSREFDEHSKEFRAIHIEREKVRDKIRAAMREGDVKKVGVLMRSLKKKEEKLLGPLFRKVEEESLFSLVRPLDTKDAFERYLYGRASKERHSAKHGK